MANVLDRYGIKEVADVTFYELDANGNPTVPALYLDTLKVSTIEQTAEEATANGGKGNAPLIVWDYGKEITVTLEDALFSAKSLAIMFGDGSIKTLSGSTKYIMKTEMFTPTVAVANVAVTASLITAGWSSNYTFGGKNYSKVNAKFYESNNASANTTTLAENTQYFCTFDLAIKDESVIEIGANTFPGTYYVTGDTYARSEASGRDELFQFVIPKAKVQSENTITLEADGDPSVFNMNLRVLRPKDGVMMKLVKYDLASGSESAVVETSLVHNHDLLDPTKD